MRFKIELTHILIAGLIFGIMSSAALSSNAEPGSYHRLTSYSGDFVNSATYTRAKWALKNGDADIPDLDTRYSVIVGECLLPKFDDLRCLFKENEFLIKKSQVFHNPFVEKLSADVFGGARHVYYHAVDAASELILGQMMGKNEESNRIDWTSAEPMIRYSYLKTFLLHKVASESLHDCQTTALVACVSSYLISYERGHFFEDPFALGKTVAEAISNQSGNCVSYSRIAVDLLEGLGLSASVANGNLAHQAFVTESLDSTQELIQSNEEKGTFHSVVEVEIQGQRYFFDPQIAPIGMQGNFLDYEYYDPNYTKSLLRIVRPVLMNP